MKRDCLPCRAPLTDDMRTILQQYTCKQGQRTPRRLRLQWFDRSPDRFYSLVVPSAGIALGIDRIIMLMGDTTQIDDITAFPPESL